MYFQISYYQITSRVGCFHYISITISRLHIVLWLCVCPCVSGVCLLTKYNVRPRGLSL